MKSFGHKNGLIYAIEGTHELKWTPGQRLASNVSNVWSLLNICLNNEQTFGSETKSPLSNII